MSRSATSTCFAGKFADAAAAIETALRLDPKLFRRLTGLWPASSSISTATMIGRSRRWNAPAKMRRASARSLFRLPRPMRGSAASPMLASRVSSRHSISAQLYVHCSRPDQLEAFSQRQRPDFPVERCAKRAFPEWPFGFSADEQVPDEWRGDCAPRLGPHAARTRRTRVARAAANQPGRKGGVPDFETVLY